MPPTRRPLGEATSRVNNSQDRQPPLKNKSSLLPLPHHESRRPGGLLQHQNQAHSQHSPLPKVETYTTKNVTNTKVFPVAVRRPSPILDDQQSTDLKRNSQVSSTSTTCSDGQKKWVGPWNLGKTLGQGATARVRKAKHSSGRIAAVKIVQKRDARLSQAGSLAALDHKDALLPEHKNARRMPLGIEREVAIMKLINHPNVMQLFDIWENHNEIYLVMEFVDNGELFDYITSKGRLKEKEAMQFWRQILSAVGYCHSFNICHRDLKPENILLTKEGVIKIADFGMAALRQADNHWLNTSCGSPHYAAPEVISGSRYEGDKVDIWSMGVILYATLAGTLPFDHPGPGITGLLALVKKGRYNMSQYFSSQARDLISRILRLDPKERPTIKKIWQHPLLRKYDYLDDLSIADKEIPHSEEECGPVLHHVSDINASLFRHLQSMWHTFDEAKLVKCLLSEQPNEQRRFYNLIQNFKATELEDFRPNELDRSSSDYHHARPLSQVRKLSTRQFSQPTKDGQGQKISRFTVVGNGKKDPMEPSLDSLRRMKPQNLELPDDYANYLHPVRLRNDRAVNPDRKPSSSQPSETGLLSLPGRAHKDYRLDSGSSSTDNRSSRAPTRRGFHTISSIASSTRSRVGTPVSGVVKPNIGHKRAINFSRQQRSPSNDARISSMIEPPTKPFHDPESGDEVSESPFKGGRNASGRYIRSRKSTRNSTGGMMQPFVKRKSNRMSHLFEDDVRQVSSSLEQDCDMAFNKNAFDRAASLRVPDSGFELRTNNNISSFQQDDPAIESSPRLPHNLQAKSGNAWWDRRPLPRPPARSESINKELAEARKHAEFRRATADFHGPPGYLDQMVNHIDHLMQPSMLSSHPPVERRSRSVPIQRKGEASRALPSIEETSMDGSRYESDIESQVLPKITLSPFDDLPTTRNARHFENGIRLVPESSIESPVKPPAPLRIKKQHPNKVPMMTGALGMGERSHHGTYESNLRKIRETKPREEDLSRNEEYEDTDDVFEENSNGTMRHKTTWFKRSSKSSDDSHMMPTVDLVHPLHEGSRKKGFGFGTLFKKRVSSKDNPRMEIILDAEDTLSISDDSQYANFEDSQAERELSARQIEPQQSWIAKLFKVKPVKKYLCCTVSRGRARRELETVFKGWKQFGLTDIVVDKQRNRIFARIGDTNYLKAKELSFAAEVLTVIEHGNRASFSIIRLTQERGAASSLERLADLLGTVLLKRGMLVSDTETQVMMIQTANSLR